MSEERKHHPFSPSSLQALEACPNYQSRDSDNEAARIGTLQHAAAETGQDNNELSDEQAANSAAAMEFVAQHKKLLEEERTSVVERLSVKLAGDDSHPDSHWGDAEAQIPQVTDLREVCLSVDDENTTAGTADRILISADGKHAILVDYKFGKFPVECASNNRQSDAYSCGVFHTYPTVEQVQVFFFQPAIKSVNKAVWTRKDTPELLLRIKTIVARAKAARAAGDFLSARPTTPVCLFCKNLAVCPAVAQKVISVAKKFAPLLVPSDLTPTRISEPAEAACGLRLATLVEAWAKAFKNLATDRVLRGGPLPNGYELTSRSTREIVDTERFKQIALMFLTDAEYATTVEVAVTKVEKLISNKAPRGQKSQTIEAFQVAAEDAGAVQKRQPYAFLKANTSE